MANILLEIETCLKKVATDCSVCLACKEVIYGPQYALVLLIGEHIGSSEEYICQSCADLCIEMARDDGHVLKIID